MGQEIAEHHFRHRDFERFDSRLAVETDLLCDWISEGVLARSAPMAGLELEAWLVQEDGTPAPRNAEFLARLADPAVVHELARFNVELNVAPQSLTDTGLRRMSDELETTWRRCREAGAALGLKLASVGTLPTVAESHLCAGNMSDSERYRALNEQVMRQRHGRPMRLAIDGAERLETFHTDVMLEAGTTSLQAHLQVTPENAVRYYNAAIIASAATVAIAANSPFLFGRQLWEETRIPLFEQAVDVGSHEASYRGSVPRVSFGTGYAGWSLAECFRENLHLFPVMLPLEFDVDYFRLAHLRLHNGTIWRWNRPLVGFDANGKPHLRIEHRVMAAGPSVTDMMANLVFFYGLVSSLAEDDVPPESILPFAQAKSNFYSAARHGIAGTVTWLDGVERPLQRVVLDDLLPRARAGLGPLGASGSFTDRALRVVESRVASGRTGSWWQRAFAERHGRDFPLLVREYIVRQAQGTPVHEWSL